MTLAKFAEVTTPSDKMRQIEEANKFELVLSIKALVVRELADSKEGMSAIGCLRYFCPSASGGDFT
jgi:hypothetical protein